MKNSLKRTAYHEAGHAISYLYFGFPVYYVTIEPEVSGDFAESLGHVDTLDKNNIIELVTSNKDIDVNQLMYRIHICASAGWEAEKIVDHRIKDIGIDNAMMQNGLRDEFEVARVETTYCELEDYGWTDDDYTIDQIRKEAESTLHKHWSEVKLLAEALLEKKSLKSNNVEVLVPTLFANTKKENSVAKLWELTCERLHG